MDDFGPQFISEMKAGETIVIPDVETDPRTRHPDLVAAYAGIATRSILDVPLVKNGRMVSLLFIHHPEPRGWTPNEAALVEETCERLWAAVERARAERRLRDSQALAQDRFAEIEQIYRFAPVGLFTFDRDYRFTRINERMAEINGFAPADHIGRSMWEIVPDLADHLVEVYRPVLERGEPALDIELHGETPARPGVPRIGSSATSRSTRRTERSRA